MGCPAIRQGSINKGNLNINYVCIGVVLELLVQENHHVHLYY